MSENKNELSDNELEFIPTIQKTIDFKGKLEFKESFFSEIIELLIEDKNQVNIFQKKFFEIFDQEWFKKNTQDNTNLLNFDEQKSDVGFKLHPLSLLVKYHLLSAIECYIESLIFIFSNILLSSEEFSRIKKDLNNAPKFFNTLFELEIITLFSKSNGKIIYNFPTKRGKDVECKVNFGDIQILVECKSLKESENSKKLKEELNLLLPSFGECSGKLVLHVSLNKEILLELCLEIETFRNSSNKTKQIDGLRYKLILWKEQPSIFTGWIMITLRTIKEKRIETTIQKILKKLKGCQIPVFAFISFSLDADLKNHIKIIKELFENKKYRKISRIYMVITEKKINRKYRFIEIINKNVAQLNIKWNYEKQKFVKEILE